MRSPAPWQTAINPLAGGMVPVEALCRRLAVPAPVGLTLEQALTNAWRSYAIPLPPNEEYGFRVPLSEEELLEREAHVRAATIVADAGAAAEQEPYDPIHGAGQVFVRMVVVSYPTVVY